MDLEPMFVPRLLSLECVVTKLRENIVKVLWTYKLQEICK